MYISVTTTSLLPPRVLGDGSSQSVPGLLLPIFLHAPRDLHCTQFHFPNPQDNSANRSNLVIKARHQRLNRVDDDRRSQSPDQGW